jgi:Tol biopolymer transport system component
MTLIAGARLGPYEILAPLGAGGMGEVYRAADTRLNRTVAIKVLAAGIADDPARRERFEREARSISSLTHPHICALYDVGRQDDIEFLVMEFVEGDTLEKRLGAGPLNVDLALDYATQIAGALDHAHSRGIVHRDLKPSNIMVAKQGVKLLDFGLAKTVAAHSILESSSSVRTVLGTKTITGEGTILGTLHYMAPEQLEGRAVDARTDIFAFGAVLCEMLTGRKTFEGASQASVIAAILNNAPPSLTTSQPGMSPALDRSVRKCLAKDPADRWQTARDLMSELAWIRASTGAQPSMAPVADRRQRVKRRVWIAGGLLLVLALLATFILFLIRPRQSAAEAVPIQFTVPPPEGSSFLACNNCMAVSPDGRHLVVVAASPDGGDQLWVRSLDSVATRALPGTDGARGPFWSPDSRAVGFVVNGKLKRIDLSGNNLQTIGDVSASQGATWSREGIVLFSSNTAGGVGLARVSISGGAISPATTLDARRAEIAHSWPQFLPDGRHFLYRIKSQKEEFTGIYVGSLDSPDRTRLVDADANPAYAAPGYLIYGTGGSVLAQMFDVATSRLSGVPVVVAQQVSYNPSSGRSAFSASQAVLTYQQIRDTELRWFDRSGNALDVVAPAGHYLDPSISPDGKRLAAIRVDPDVGRSHVWLFDVARRSSSPFTSGPTSDRSPIWSPDGGLIAFASKRSAGFDIYQKSSTRTDGAEDRLDLPGFPLGWSPDGRFMVCQHQGTGPSQPDTLEILFLGDGRSRLSQPAQTFVGGQGQLSADGHWLAYMSEETGRSEVYVRAFPSAEGRTQVSLEGGVQPKWRRDGKELFYLAPDRRLMAVAVKADSAFIAGVPTALFTTRTEASTVFNVGRNEYDVTANGDRFLMNVPAEGTSSPITVVVNWVAALRH